MRHYRLGLLDQPKSSWVLHDVLKRSPKRNNPEMPSAFYKFFSPPDANVEMKERFRSLCCPKCGKYDSDEVFDKGFEEPMAIQFKQDFAWTDDRQLVMNDKCLKALKSAKTQGFETKPIGKSGWHVVRVTERVANKKGAYSLEPPKCSKCGIHDEGGGGVWAEHQITLPKKSNTLFTTKLGSPAIYAADREVFLTEDVLEVLKGNKITGPYCDRLQSDEEIAKRKQMEAKGKNWMPPGMTQYLKGK